MTLPPEIVHAMFEHPDLAHSAEFAYPGDTDKQNQFYSEAAYRLFYGAMPEWAHLLDDVLMENGALIFVYAQTEGGE